jgi:hypothetical protein
MGVTIKKKQTGKAYATTEAKHGGANTENIEVELDGMVSPQACEVYIEMGNTVNTGNYESSRFTVGLRMPCNVDTIEETYTQCQEWVNEKLSEMNQELADQLNGG